MKHPNRQSLIRVSFSSTKFELENILENVNVVYRAATCWLPDIFNFILSLS